MEHDLPVVPTFRIAVHVEPYGIVPGMATVQASNLPEALRLAAELPLLTWFPPNDPEPKLRVEQDDDGDVYVSREDDLMYPYDAWEGLVGRGYQD